MHSQHGSMKGKWCFNKTLPCLAEEGGIMGVTYCDCGKAFDTVSNNMLTDKHTKYRPD